MEDRPLRILHLEDEATDRELIQRAIERAGLRFTTADVDGEAGFVRALEEFYPDIVLADYRLPDYDGLQALKLVRGRDPILPFIFVSGTLGDERAVEAVKQGATDYVLKENLARLPTAITRAMTEVEELRERRRLEDEVEAQRAALEDSRQRLQGLFDGASEAMILADDTGAYVDVNPAACTLTGFSREELIGAHPWELVATDQQDADHEVTEATWAQLLAEGRQGGEIAVHRKDGSTLQAEYRAVANIVPGIHLSVLRDVTDRKRMEAELRASEERFRRLAENAQDVVFRLLTGDEPELEYLSPASERVLGRSPTDLMAEPAAFAELVAPRDGEASGRITRWARPDGTVVWLDVRRSLVEDAAGQFVAVEGIIRDVTERLETQEALRHALDRERQAAERLRNLNQLKDAFLTGVSHEIRTPLTSIVGMSKLLHLRHAELPTDQVQELLERVNVNAERLERMLTDLLDIDRLTRGGALEPNLQEVDLGGLVLRVLENLDLRGHPLATELDPLIAMVDGPKIERIVGNLVGNAVRHTPEGSEILVRLAPDDGGVHLTVEDAGPGIPDDLKKAVFELFHPGTSAAARISGAGVGLPIVSRFVALHRGRVWVADRDGGGASFHVWLPNPVAGETSAAPPDVLAEDPPREHFAGPPGPMEPPAAPGGGGLPAPHLARLLVAAAGIAILHGLATSDLISPRTSQLVASLASWILASAAAVACLWTARRGASAIRPAWAWLGVGMLLWSIGDGIWAVYEVVLDREVPYPSAADAAYVAAYLPLVAGVVAMVRTGATTRTRIVIDGIQVALGLGLLVWVLGLDAVFASRGAGWWADTVTVAYPLADIILVTVTVMLVATTVAGSRPLWLLAAGLASLAVADTAYAFLELSGGYVSGVVTDTGYVAGFLLVGLAAYDAARSQAPRGDVLPDRYTRLGLVPVGIAATVLVVGHLWKGGTDLSTVAVSAAIMLLAAHRQYLALRTERQRALALQRLSADLQASNDELTASHELRDHFVSVVAHELASPLTTIGGFAQLLAARWDAVDPESRVEQLDAMARQTRRLTRLVEDLLTVGRIDQQHLPVSPARVWLPDLAVRFAAELGPDADQFDIDLPEVAAWADPDHVLQILLNLATNALKHGAPPRRVDATVSGDRVQLSVTDHGPGVPPSFQSRLFQRFARPEGSERVKGVGLGLSIVAGLAAANDGSVGYEPAHPTGARFTVELPRAVTGKGPAGPLGIPTPDEANGRSVLGASGVG